MKKTVLLLAKLSLAAMALFFILGTSCITTGNIMVAVYPADLVGQTNENFHEREIDLKKNGDWNEHKDQLNSIDDIGFACLIKNNTSSAATGQIYISDKLYSSATAAQTGAVKILDGIVVAPNATREIKWQDSYDFLTNFNEAKKIIYTERFYIYFMVKETPFSIDVTKIVIFLSVNGKA
jgi:hypothetical protein